MFWHFPWSLPPSETIKLRSCRNLIQHYLGNYMEHLTLHQLSINLHNGIGTVSDITLNCEEINKFGNDQNWPVEIVKGHMEDITVKVPWSNVFKDDSVCKINGLSLTIQPKSRTEPVRSLLKWILSTWTTLSNKQPLPITKRDTDLERQAEELFVEAMEAIFKRIKVQLENTKLRIEHFPQQNNERGVILDIHIRSIDCCNEPVSNPKPRWTDYEYSHSYNKRSIKIEGVTLSSHNYPTKHYHSSKQSYQDNPLEFHKYRSSSRLDKQIFQNMFVEMKNDFADLQTIQNINLKDIRNDFHNDVELNQNLIQPGSIFYALLNHLQDITYSLKEGNVTEGPLIQAKSLDPIVIVVSPKEIDSVIGLLKGIIKRQPTDTRKANEEAIFPGHMFCCLN